MTTNLDKVRAAARAIEADLGEGWRATRGEQLPRGAVCEVIRPDGQRITVEDHTHRMGRPDGRLYVAVNFGDLRAFVPREYHAEHGKYPQIGMSIDKAPAKVAADVRRRLLPGYAEAFAAALAAKERHDAEERREQELLAAVAEACGGKVIDVRTVYGPDDFRARTVGNNRVHIEVTLPRGLALSLARTVKQWEDDRNQAEVRTVPPSPMPRRADDSRNGWGGSVTARIPGA